MSNFRITTIWAFVAVDPDDGDEGIIAGLRGGTWVPLIGADQKRLESLRPVAEQLAREKGREIRLVRFDQRTDVETIRGRGPQS